PPLLHLPGPRHVPAGRRDRAPLSHHLRKEKSRSGVNRGSGGNEMSPIRHHPLRGYPPASRVPAPTLTRSFPLIRATVLLLLVLPAAGCTHGGGGGAATPEVKLSAADMAGFLKTSVSGKRGGTLMDATFVDP